MSSYIFGPVPSRRLGRSLGIDLVPFKTCTFDCIYCQLSQTTCKTIQRQEWVPLEGVAGELKSKLDTKPDYITLSGSGEPTLYSKNGELIKRIKEMTDIPVAVITNSSLLWQREVRESILAADLIVPSLDAGNEAMFKQINRPHPEITFEKTLDGLIQLRNQYHGQYWLEVFLLAGLNTIKKELQNLIDCIGLIRPDRVQLNTVTRPPAEREALAVSKEQMEAILPKMGENAEIIADYRHVHAEEAFATKREDILNLLRRRPCPVGEIADVFGLHRNEVLKYVEELSTEGEIVIEMQERKGYYKVPADNEKT